tara:strand:- start:148 stop:420 length:273 start_codon:yes stop_codon:yes gene_type:complete
MQEKKIYGQLSSETFDLGDIVEWKSWNSDLEEWEKNYGIVTDMKPKVMSNRLVYIITVLPVDNNAGEKEFFSMSLKLISKANNAEHERNC